MAQSSRTMKAAVIYARTVLDLAHGQKVEPEVTGEMLALSSLFSREMAVARALRNPALSGEKKATLAQPLIAKASPLTGKLIQLLAAKNRLALLPDIAEAYLSLEEQSRRIRRAKVVSAAPLSPAQLQTLADALAAKAPGSTYKLENTVDSQLIAGFRVEEGDSILDATLRFKLDALRQRLAA